MTWLTLIGNGSPMTIELVNFGGNKILNKFRKSWSIVVYMGNIFAFSYGSCLLEKLELDSTLSQSRIEF